MRLFSLLLLCFTLCGGTLLAQIQLPLDFENDNLAYNPAGFEGAASQVIVNPDQSGENTSGRVVETIKTDGAQFFAGTTITLDTPIDFSTDKGISIQTWSPKADIPVRLKLENTDASAFVELDANTTVENSWETLTYDFTPNIDVNVAYTKVIVFFEFIDGLAGDGSTYYYDNIEVVAIAPPNVPVVLPLTFEDTNADYAPIGFEGAISTVIDNPDQSGINTSARVLESVKTAGAQFFAGTAINLDAPIEFDGDGSVFIDTWSPKADIPVKLRLEDANNTAGIEVDVNTTVSNEWETLTYDFSSLINPDVDYVRVVVFFEFIDGLAGDGSTYYFDNVGTSIVNVREVLATPLEVFPNPASELLTIVAPEQMERLRVFSLNGALVADFQPHTERFNLGLAEFKPGTYVALATTPEGLLRVRFVKQ